MAFTINITNASKFAVLDRKWCYKWIYCGYNNSTNTNRPIFGVGKNVDRVPCFHHSVTFFSMWNIFLFVFAMLWLLEHYYVDTLLFVKFKFERNSINAIVSFPVQYTESNIWWWELTSSSFALLSLYICTIFNSWFGVYLKMYLCISSHECRLERSMFIICILTNKIQLN